MNKMTSQQRGRQTDQQPVVKLCSCGVLCDVLESRAHGEQVFWNPLPSHLGKGVVYKTSIQASHKGS